MNNIKQFLRKRLQREDQEAGQSIVLIALALVGLLAFAGLAIDVGFIFARGSQLQAAVDSAALAGVVEVAGGNTPANQARAITKSGQFLNANGMPISVTESINLPSYTDFNRTELGVIEYELTATWPVETFFMKAIGFNNRINLTRSAEAAIFSLADIYASRRVEEGILGTSNQSVFGPHICTGYGDPYSPFNSPYTNDEPYSYRYRILIPDGYEKAAGTNYLRVELFDPDSMNSSNNSATVSRTDHAVVYGGLSAFASLNCDSTNRKNACLINTGESPNGVPVGGLEPDQVNPFWFLRVDENRYGTASGVCGEGGSYDQSRNTATRFELYYYRQNADGTIQKTDLASYTGQTGTEAFNHETDLHWVSPGANVSFAWDKTTGNLHVPVDPGSRTERGFEIDLSREVPGIVTETGSNNRYIYLDVTAINGSSENGFELWAGPEYWTSSISSNVNRRNVEVLNKPGSHSSFGATVLAMGNLPMNSNANYTVDIPLLYVGPELAGESIHISLFDPDSGAQRPVMFYFDSIAEEDFSLVFQDPTKTFDPDGVRRTDRCQIGGSPSCDNRWVDPPFEIIIPGNTDDCNRSNPATDPNCVPFYGGRLIARYKSGAGDTYGWQITITGLPYLVK